MYPSMSTRSTWRGRKSDGPMVGNLAWNLFTLNWKIGSAWERRSERSKRLRTRLDTTESRGVQKV